MSFLWLDALIIAQHRNDIAFVSAIVLAAHFKMSARSTDDLVRRRCGRAHGLSHPRSGSQRLSSVPGRELGG
jgi:hypothetical protein